MLANATDDFEYMVFAITSIGLDDVGAQELEDLLDLITCDVLRGNAVLPVQINNVVQGRPIRIVL